MNTANQFSTYIKPTIKIVGMAAFVLSSYSHAGEASNRASKNSTAALLASTTSEHQQLKGEAKLKIKTFSTSLKQALLKAIKQGGLENGIEVCQQVAPKIAQQLSTDGWTVGRTSLKVRNPENAPDKWEHSVLMDFEQRAQQGEQMNQLVASKVDDDQQFRMMKAIPTGGLCLSCHGQKIEPSVENKLLQLYPDDKATGFELGDIRGAFTLIKDIK